MKKRKIFVLDTNVLIHDPTAILRFQEHDVYLPIVVLEELDKAKVGMSEVARNVRQVCRFLDELVEKANGEIGNGVKIPSVIPSVETGRLHFHMEAVHSVLPNGMRPELPDNMLLGITLDLSKAHPDRDVILVTKDINLRIKAHALNIHAEDYTTDQVLEDANLLYTGVEKLNGDFWESAGKNMESWKQEGRTYYRITSPRVRTWFPGLFLYNEEDHPFEAMVRKIDGETATIEVVKDFRHEKHKIWGINARNREQNFAFNMLMDPEIDFITLLGHAGTGKTLMALAAALNQTLEQRRYAEIIMTRQTVPVGEDIGFLPGTEEEKMGPWMGALEDNLDVLHDTGSTAGQGAWGRAATHDLLKSRIRIKSLNFMRGRTFLRKFLIIDEAQNLSPHQIKTLITRAGPGSKIVCCGNIAQIDTPYLTETTSGLTFAVDRFKGWEHSGHITLQRGERSRLADYASENL
jgi:PhoH-like ATPase